ncbi:hypothetical protein RJ55_05219 [Drechmeria coniospora]|nr:hypothetical protein RJ55_05219 [Drechmeria coniospora]
MHLCRVMAAVVIHAAVASAITTSYCVIPDVCFRWGVPEANTTSKPSSVYLQLKAPITYEWIGLGIGSQMRGAYMFIMYADGKGNVTLSTRQSTGYVMPQHVANGNVKMLEGSGIVDGQMIANVKCGGGCNNLALQGSAGWIAGWKVGSPLNSTSASETITFHDGYNGFNVDLKKSTISVDANPFLNSQNSSSNGKNASTAVTGGETASTDSQTLVYAHGILMTIIFVIGYPIGSILMPLLGNWIIHASWQSLIFLCMWVGFGLGYALASRAGAVRCP